MDIARKSFFCPSLLTLLMRNHIQSLLGRQFPEVILGLCSSRWFHLLNPTCMAGQSTEALQRTLQSTYTHLTTPLQLFSLSQLVTLSSAGEYRGACGLLPRWPRPLISVLVVMGGMGSEKAQANIRR